MAVKNEDGDVVRNEDGTQVGSVDRSLEENATDEAAPEAMPADDGDDDEDLANLYKAELVERAEAAGIDTSGMKKAEIVAALEAAEEGEPDGDDSVS